LKAEVQAVEERLLDLHRQPRGIQR
jgi:hypothetical protein